MTRLFSFVVALCMVAVAFGFRATMKMGEFFVFLFVFYFVVEFVFCTVRMHGKVVHMQNNAHGLYHFIFIEPY